MLTMHHCTTTHTTLQSSAMSSRRTRTVSDTRCQRTAALVRLRVLGGCVRRIRWMTSSLAVSVMMAKYRWVMPYPPALCVCPPVQSDNPTSRIQRRGRTERKRSPTATSSIFEVSCFVCPCLARTTKPSTVNQENLGKFILVEVLGIEPSPFASKATVLETVCAPYTTPHFNIISEQSSFS